ncbi:MAG: hypothetical protein ABIU95_07940, partial [Burkholderiales bacterium]
MSTESAQFRVGGVTVVALGPAGLIAQTEGTPKGTALEIGRTVTDSDGAFELHTAVDNPSVERLACVLRACSEIQFTLAVFDGDMLLLEDEPRSYSDEMRVELTLPDPDRQPPQSDWAALGHRVLEMQTVQLGDIAVELASLGPKRIFASWSATRRLALLRQLEQALLDPSRAFERSSIPLRLSQLTSPTDVERLRERLRREQRDDLMQALDSVVARARAIGHWADLDLRINPEKLAAGDLIGAVNHFIDDRVFHPDLFPWIASPRMGYRDYLRDRWSEPQRFEQVLGGPDKEVATRATMIQRLN